MARPSILRMLLGSLAIVAIVLIVNYVTDYSTFDARQEPRPSWSPAFRNTTEDTLRSNKKVLIIYWSRIYGARPRVSRNHVFPYFYAGDNCAVDCELTTDKKRINEASAIVVYATDPGGIPPRTMRNVTWILHTNENPTKAPALRNPDFMSLFNYLVSYRLDADFSCSSFKKPSLDLPVPFKDKKGLVVVVLSNCERVRTKYIAELMKHIKVDSYGKCLKNMEGFVGRRDKNAFTAVTALQKDYLFSLVFPNADCDYYMTEKIGSALSAGSVPVWLGTDTMEDVFQWGNFKHSVIKVRDFSSPQKLAEYLKYLAGNETAYNEYLKWKYEGFDFPKEYYQSPIGQWWDGLPLYCQVCMRIAKDPKGHDGLPADRCDGNQTRTEAKWLANIDSFE